MRIKELKFWVQKVLPLVYDDSLSYYELLDKVVRKLNEVIDLVNGIDDTIVSEVNSIMNKWIEDGTFEELINQTVLTNLNTKIDNTTAELEEAVEDIGILETRADSTDTAITGIGERIDGVDDRIDGVDTTLTEMQNDIDSAESRIASLEERTTALDVYLLITDSYGSDDPDNDRTSWCTTFAYLMGLTMGTDCFKYQKAGAGFAHNSGEPGSAAGKNFCDVLNSAIADMTETERNSVTKLIIGGGVNDWDGTNADTAVGINNFDAIAKRYYPNAKIYAICCGWSKRADIRWATLQRYGVYFNAGTAHGWLVHNTAYQALQNKSCFVSTDDVHPNTTGSTMIAKEIVSLIKGGNFLANECQFSDVIVNGNTRGRACVSNNFVHVWLGTFSPGALPNIGAGLEVNVCEITCPVVFGGGARNEEHVGTINMHIGNEWITKRMNFGFSYNYQEGKTYLTAHNNVEFDGNTFGTYSNITDSYITLGNVVLSPYA